MSNAPEFADLPEIEAFFNAIFEVNPAIKLLLDGATGKVLDANSAAVAFYGWSRDELRTMYISEINMMEPERLTRELEETRKGNRRYFNFDHRTRFGEIKNVEVFTGPFRHGGRDLLFSIIHDNTDRRRLEARAAQVQKMDAIGQLAGTIAHDFNNLLAIVLGYADILSARLPDGSEHRRPIEEIMRAAKQARDVNRKLLTFSRQETVELRDFDLAELVRQLLPVLGRVLGDQVALVTELPAGALIVRADPAQFEQVVLNLLTNARDALPSGGTVCLRLQRLAGDAELPEGECACLSVQDDGTGMSAEARRRAFEPFFTTKVAGQGTGLGLSTVYGIARQAGGTARIASELGRGSTVSVYLPMGTCLIAPRPPRGAPTGR